MQNSKPQHLVPDSEAFYEKLVISQYLSDASAMSDTARGVVLAHKPFNKLLVHLFNTQF